MRRFLFAVLAALAVLATPALAAKYPPPGNPGHITKPPKHGKTLRVCKHGKHRFRTIQKAVNKAKAGDTIRVCPGVYHEGVFIQNTGSGKKRHYRDYLKLVGDAKHPRKVVIDSKGVKGVAAQNGVEIFGANHVSVSGFYARNYKGNGFFALSVTGYDLNHLVAGHGGTYGIYAFDSKGGSMTNDEAFYNNDSGFYIGQTKPQTKPLRSRVAHVTAWGNVLGFSGTNMRYVTITKSRWYNNGLGIVPNALTSEKYAPPEDNVITDNDVFWNNFDYFHGAPFKLKKGATGDLAYPVGIGVLIFGGRRNVIQNNRIYGNYLAGAGFFEQILFITDKDPKIQREGVLVGNQLKGNHYGLGGADLNGRDAVYDGEGRQNCVQETDMHSPTIPADGHTFKPCPFAGSNVIDGAAQGEGLGWAGDTTHEAHWIRHPHKPIKGITPLEECVKVKNGCQGQPNK